MSRQIGYTTEMLQRCVSLVPELDALPVLVRAHCFDYARDLAHQFAEMSKLKGYSITRIGPDGPGIKVVLDDRAVFIFISYKVRESFCIGRSFREVFTDNSVWVTGVGEYDPFK